MTPRGDSELALRLLKDSFFLGTGINISMMFCLETFIVETTDLPGYYKNEVVARFQALLG